MPNPTEPLCKFDEGCHRVVPCEPGCGTPWPVPALRDRIADAVAPFLMNFSNEEAAKVNAGELADAVLAVLSPIDPSLKRVLDAVVAERQRQDEKWGVQNMHDFEHISILTEEVGEAAKAANEANFTSGSTRGDFTHLRKELIQVAAVAVDHVQAIDRRSGAEDSHG